MSTIVTRAGKGSPLTNTEVDSNFTNLNTDKVEKSGDTMTGDLAFGDNVKAKFGASDDLVIEHNGTNSLIKDQGTGDLSLLGNNLKLGNTFNTETYLYATVNGAVSLYYDNAEKLATTSSGVDITGTVVADGFLGGTNVLRINSLEGSRGSIQISAPHLLTREVTYGNNFYLASDGTYTQDSAVIGGGLLQMTAPNADFGEFLFKSKQDPDSGGAVRDRLKIANTGDISFYDDAGTSQDLYWDASTSRLGLGTTTPSAPLTVDTSAGTFAVEGEGGSSNRISSTGALVIKSGNFHTEIQREDGVEIAQFVSDTGDVIFYSDTPSQDFYWDASTSRLGLGTTTPSGVIHAVSSGVSNFVFQGSDVGEGTLFQIRNGTNNSATGNGHRLEFVHGNNNSRNVFFRTSSTGTFGRSPELYIGSQNDSGGAELDHVRIRAGGDVSFYNDDSTSEDFYWDASLSRLGLGTANPEAPLEVAYTTSAPSLEESDAGLLLSANNTLRTMFGADPSSPFAHWIQVTNSGGSAAFPLALNPQGGNVGIGTASPDSLFHISSGGPKITITDTTFNADATITVNDAGSLTFSADANNERTNSRIQFDVDGSEAMRIDSSGRLLIGRTVGTSKLYVSGTSADIAINDSSGTYNYRQTTLKVSGDRFLLQTRNGDGSFVSQDYIVDKGASGATSHQWLIDASEAARIDSSGNLLVGTTDSTLYNSTSDTGIAQLPSGKIEIARSGGTLLTLNRLTSDGTIAEFRKDGSTVGYIGTNNDQLYIGRDDTGIRFTSGDDALLPVNANSGALRSGSIDLGRSYSTFRNLYLSGGVYLGGTGSSNLLDDYEEGTWTPTATVNGFNQTISSLAGEYTKIGQSVTVTCKITLSTAGYASSYSQIGTLPFTPSVNSTGAYSSGTLSGNGRGDNAVVLSANTNLWLHEDSGTQTSGVWFATVTYFTDS